MHLGLGYHVVPEEPAQILRRTKINRAADDLGKFVLHRHESEHARRVRRLEPDEHIGVVRSPNTNPVMARHDEPLVLVSFEMTGIGPMKTELYTRLGEDMLKPVDAETLENPLYRELQVPCKRCDGTGKSDNGLVACTICLGDGVVPNSILV